jgi:hypothetical protein
MPIRAEFRDLYPADWRRISAEVRFGRAGGACQRCCRPHGATLRVLPDGRWFDPAQRTWRDGRGKPARWPDIEDAIRFRETRVVLATAHLDHNPRNNRRRNLRALCQRCHLIHDRPRHLRQRWLTCRRRYAIGDLFLGRYVDLVRAAASVAFEARRGTDQTQAARLRPATPRPADITRRLTATAEVTGSIFSASL